ncbi:hypothetical protein ACTFIY_012485 [Dictyostelium cf. discoideum]
MIEGNLEKNNDNQVAINAGLIDLEENWHSFEPLFFGINPTDAKQIDPQIKLMLKLIWKAFEDASIDPLILRGTNTSVFVGAANTDFSFINFEQNEAPINVFNGTLSAFANRISYCFDLRGTSLTIDTACSSSLNAVHLGYESIVNGKSNYSVVAGCNILLNPYITRSFHSINITGKSGRCNSFDESADDFVRSEGVVVLILKRLSLAIQDGDQIYCVMKGSSSNVDYIDFFELHSTGTQVGDPIEVEAVADIFKNVKKEPLLIGSVKSNIGHLEPASGVASLAKVCLMFKHRQFVKNIHFKNPNPNIKFKEWNVKVCTETTAFPDRQVSMTINSFGITGSNACVLLSEYIKPSELKNQTTTKLNEKSKLLIPISTNSKKSLEQFKSKLLEEIDTYSESLTFEEFAMFQIGNDWNDLKVNINEIISKNNKSSNIIKSNYINPPLEFSFCGQGPQYSKMGLDLYENEPIFKESMDLLDAMLFKYYGYSIIQKLRSINDDPILINEPILAQPSIFMIQISLYKLYLHWGITPSIIVGHSLGEVASAFCSGMIDLETACFMLYKRAIIQNKTNGSGRLLAIALTQEEFNNQFSKEYPEIEISCFNSPSSIVVCGSELDILNISKSLKEKQIFNALLGAPSAFHSSKQDIIKDEIIEEISHIQSTLPSVTTFSTVTTNKFDENTPYDSNYVFDNIRNPVLFQQTIENIFKHIESNDLGNSVIFLELSPHPTLNHYIKEMIPKNSNYFLNKDSISVLSSLNKKKEDINEIQSTISQLYCFGYNIDFSTQFKSEVTSNSFKKCSYLIPHYQWDESLFWREGISSRNTRKNGASINQLGNKNESSPHISYTSYIDIKEEPFRFLKGHQFRGKSIDFLYFKTTCFLKYGTVLLHSPLVTVSSTLSTNIDTDIECPNNQLFSQCLQPKDSILQSPLILKEYFNQQLQLQQSNIISISTISSYLFSTLKKILNNLTIDEFQNNSLEHLGRSTFRSNLILLSINFLLTHHKHIDQNQVSNFLLNNIPNELLVVDTIVSKKGISHINIYQHQLILDIISKSITPVGNEKIVFRILEIGCVGELTKLINDKLESILNDNPSYNIDIEFVFSDYTDSKVLLIKERLFNSKKSCFFKIIDLNKQLQKKSFSPSYYDLIILSNTTNQINDIKTSISFINEILTPNGHLLILDTNFIQTSIDEDYYLENYKQWLSFNYLNSGNGAMKLNQWNQLLINDLKFNNFICSTGKIEPYLIQVQKSNLSNSINSVSKEHTSEYDQIIIFGTCDEINISSSFCGGSGGLVPITMNSIDKFKEHVKLQPLTDKSLILFIESVNLLTVDNFNQVSMNYIEINQHLLKNEISGCKHILISRNVNFGTSNLFGSSLIGSFRYFCEFNQLNIYSFEFEEIYSTKNTDYEHLIKEKLIELKAPSQEYGSFSMICVDLIVNTLSADHMDANFNCLSQGGRIIDLSITHMTTTDTTDFYKFRNHIGYITYESVVAASGKLKTIPFNVYRVTKTKEAIESLGDRKHIGKNIINFNDPEGIDIVDSLEFSNNHNFIHRSSNYKIHQDTLGKTILITGQAGLSDTIIKWIREKRSDSIESIIVLSKSPIKFELERAIDIKPIESIFHNAFSPAGCEPLEIDMNHLIGSHSAKSMGAYNLHKLSLNWPIKQFVLSSSVTSILGSQRQCGYVASNCFIDALSRYRKSLNLPCISINWGLLDGGGFAARNDAVFKLFELQGLVGISKDLVWGSLDLLLQNQNESTNKMVASFEFQTTCKTYKNHKLLYKLDYFLNPIISKESVTYEKKFSIRQDIVDKFASLLSIDQSKLNLDIKIIDYGADSLLVVEVKNWP